MCYLRLSNTNLSHYIIHNPARRFRFLICKHKPTDTVQIEISIFGGIIDLSTGLIASSGFTNDFVLTAATGVDLTGYEDLTNATTCENGLAVDSEFVFDVVAFATQWYKTTLYSVALPILKSCFEHTT